MNAIRLIHRLHQHRLWANAKLIAAAEALSDEQLRQTFPIDQRSIWKSLLHLYAAEYVWLEALNGDECPVVPGDVPGKLPGNQQGAGAITTLAELKAKWADLDERWAEYLFRLDQQFDEIVFKRPSSGAGKRHEMSRADVLLHVCLHAQYTAAQVVNMLRQVGATSLPDVMLISMARDEAGTT